MVFFSFPSFPLILLSLTWCSLSSQQNGGREEGFVLFCPCMGRFGNQVDQLLGTMAFAQRLNRTLVLPPLLDYPPGAREARMLQFDSLFQLAPFAEFFLPVLPMREFMAQLAPTVWPAERRRVLCWAPRPGLANPAAMGCHATEGNPFGPFWRHAGVQFVGDQYFGYLTGGFDVGRDELARKWASRFPIDQHPVLAFSSAPAHFPIRSEHWPLQKYLRWSDRVQARAKEFIGRRMGGGGPFVGVHLRNGPDWERACRLTTEGGTAFLFASAQCTGDANEFGSLGPAMCLPPLHIVLSEIVTQVRRVNATAVFVASDWRHHLAEIGAHLANSVPWPVRVLKWTTPTEGGGGKGANDEPDEDLGPHVPAHILELALLTMADHLIANCVSTFSAFAVRHRLFHQPQAGGRSSSTSFFAFPNASLEMKREEGQQRGKEERRERTSVRSQQGEGEL